MCADTDREVCVLSNRPAPSPSRSPDATVAHGRAAMRLAGADEIHLLLGGVQGSRRWRWAPRRQTFHAGQFACRPPGMPHGPWRSEEGVSTYEVRYPAPAER